jgi:hypothetical protein
MSRAVRLAGALGLWALAAHAHVVSMSSGEITINGARAHYELKMPLYEVAHVQDPARNLPAHIHFAGATMIDSLCGPDPAHNSYVCNADYSFATPVDRLDVDCTFPSITVPNHVHMLRAQLNGKNDQAVFDSAFPHATLLFRPPTPMEIAATQTGAGAVRALDGAVQVLFLAALALAGRTRRELLALAGMFVGGQVLAALAMPHIAWQPALRFVEAAMALALAYLAVEILLLPTAGSRWAMAGVLGIFQGLYFDAFLRNTGYSPLLVLAGATLAEVLGIAILALFLSQLNRVAKALRPVQVEAAALLVIGMAWFFLRLRG